ncbi:MAG: hypothetical protein KDC97_04125 [Confluentibacter sp.]|nr:hypothetical protein [Confluentibacter sp.]HMQ42947.1 hypothetical protein [Mariniflexile sp.]HMR15662.1 hypothetical protein [Mariniflexile sp.]
MKPKSALKFGIGLLIIIALSLVTFNSFAKQNKVSQLLKSDNITVTIDKKTTEDGFKDIKSMLKEHGIEATFTAIERNDLGELTGLKIELKDGNNGLATSKVSSNLPISEITFGRKDGMLFISKGKNAPQGMSLFSQNNMPSFSFDSDSLTGPNLNAFGGFNLNDFFNGDGDSIFFGGNSLNMDKVREQMQQLMQQSFTQEPYSFYDDPNTNKLIIIDGKESDFKTLDRLSKENKISEIDDLKPKTAMSIYGEKAKDGAIIITTK